MAPGRILGEAAHDEGSNRRVYPLRQRTRSAREDVRSQRKRRFSPERLLPHRHFVQDDSERPEIAADVGCATAEHLRREIRERATDPGELGVQFERARRNLLVDGHQFGDPEIEDLRPPVGLHHHVCALQIAVRYSPVVGVSDCVGDLQRVVQKLVGREAP